MGASLQERYGSWVVVTGASSGIGEAYARHFASEGLDVVVVARRIDRLKALGFELEAAHGVEIRPVQADLSTTTGVDSLVTAISELDVAIVVSNAGSTDPGAFLARTPAERHQAVHLNVLTAVDLAHALGSRLVTRGRGAMIFTGSTSAFSPVSFMATYAASKAFVGSFAQALHDEWKASGIDVLVSHPGPTRTDMVNMDGIDFSGMPVVWMTPDQVVAQTLKALGKKSEVIPGMPNRFQRFMFTRLMPRRMARFIWRDMMKRVTADELQAPR